MARYLTTTVNGKTSKKYVPQDGEVRCFVATGDEQARQSDVTATTPSQVDAVIFAQNGACGVGDRLTLTRPKGLGTFEITDVRAMFDGYSASHIECAAKEVVSKS